jgi:HD domain
MRIPMNDHAQDMREIGSSVASTRASEELPPISQRPTLVDIMLNRMHRPKFGLPIAAAAHGAQCGSLAMKAGCDEETVLACLLHDIGLVVQRPDHGWWGAQLVEPYVSERVSWAIRYHQALRYYADPEVGYQYPEMYVQMFGRDYEPPEYLDAAYRTARNHKWYMTARHITLYDDYSFDRTAPINVEPFADIIGRHFRQPREGLGNDASATAHMWRTIIDPTKPL